jgi:hypothetical protein
VGKIDRLGGKGGRGEPEDTDCGGKMMGRGWHWITIAAQTNIGAN